MSAPETNPSFVWLVRELTKSYTTSRIAEILRVRHESVVAAVLGFGRTVV